MRFPLRVLAVLTFLGWLFATGHVVLSHGGEANGETMQTLASKHDDHHHDAPDPAGHHHHDLTLVTAGQSTKTVEVKVLAPIWLPLLDDLAARLTALSREEEKSHGDLDSSKSPPDERAAGWLLVVQTALPVRGPSLV